MRILLVEDDQMIGEAVSIALKDAAYAVDWVKDGAAVDSVLEHGEHQAVLLDLGLPKRDGLEVLRRLRLTGNTIPVIVITARDGVEDRIKGLDFGADDYLLKPFDVNELLARLRAVIRRQSGQAANVLSNGIVTLDLGTREARSRDAVESLSAREFALLTLLPLLLLLPVMVWLIIRIVCNQLTPVSRLAGHLDAQPADRPLPLSDRNIPDEIVPFVHAINRLLARVGNLVSQQRRFIADAAHELRSPLTALSIQAQNLKQSGTLEVMRERVLPLQDGIERARKLTEQLLNLARTQAETLEVKTIDVSAMARELVAEYLPISDARNIDLGLDEVVPLSLITVPETLRLILRNALENAVKYAPDGGEVTLRLDSKKDGDVIEIVDDGPGVPASERERVFDPFYRIPGTAGEGSGLGLSIAREAASSLGGTVSLHERTEGGGSIFRFQLNRQ